MTTCYTCGSTFVCRPHCSGFTSRPKTPPPAPPPAPVPQVNINIHQVGSLRKQMLALRVVGGAGEDKLVKLADVLEVLGSLK